MSAQLGVLATLFALTLGVCQAQIVVPAFLPKLQYPPLARATRVEGDVVVSFRRTREGRTVDVTPISGRSLLRPAAVENVKAWRFEAKPDVAQKPDKATFHFRLNPPDDRYDDGQPATKVELDGTGGVQVISVFTTGLERS